MFRLLGFLLLFIVRPVQAMSFKVETLDRRPIAFWYDVYGDGEIVSGDTDNLLRTMQEAGVSFDRRITVYLHSPGGSVVEALKLGRLISKLKANTSVGRSSATSAECLSACVWAYLGGTYRFLPDTSEVGVHQFAFVNDKAVQTETATAVSQSMAAEIVEFMKQNRADTDFFKLVTSALPRDMYLVPHDKPRELRVVTDNIWDESWSFEYTPQGDPTRNWVLNMR
jgi:hypothetical protein